MKFRITKHPHLSYDGNAYMQYQLERRFGLWGWIYVDGKGNYDEPESETIAHLKEVAAMYLKKPVTVEVFRL
jgi:hypothetical protein